MSKVSRIKRPTYATPRKTPTGRFFYVSTDYAVRDLPARFRKVGPGSTYRRAER